MKIVDIQERTVSIASRIRNAYIDFSRMTVSVAAVVTDVIRDGKPVVGYGFNSNGRYAQGRLLRERFIPRIREADPGTYATEEHDNLDPFRPRGNFFFRCLTRRVPPSWPAVVFLWPGRSVRHQ
jgi:hypothetical protein